MGLPQELFQALETQFKGMFEKYGIPGFAFTILEGNKITYSKGVDFRNKEKKLPYTPDTICAIGSASKSFAALSIMQLFEKGKLKLTDPIDKFLPIKWARKYGKDKPITIHHLISQTSGISDLGLAKILINPQILHDNSFEKFDVSTPEAYINHINGAYDFINPPGRYSYCNSNFTLAHMIVEKVTGQSYDDYVQQNIFTPCEMKKSTLKTDIYKKNENRMMGYLMHNENGKWRPEPIDYVNYWVIWGCGGIYATANDLGNYLITLTNNGIFNGKKVISSASIDKLFTSNTSCHEFEEFGIKGLGSLKGDGGYAYGCFVVNDFFGQKVVVLPGSVEVSSSMAILMPKLKIGITLTWNGGEEIFGEVISTILGTFAKILGKDPMQEFGIIQEDMRLNKLYGTYYDYIRGHPLEITREGYDLFIEWLGGEFSHRPKTPLHPIDKEGGCMKYYTKTSPTGYDMIEFIFEENNRVRLLIEKHTMFKEEKIK